jgi:hypothetical protein
MDYTDKIKESAEFRRLGLQSKLNKNLKEFLKHRYEIVFSIHDAEIANMFSICMMQVLQLDMCEDEDEDIDLSKLIYFNISNVIEHCDDQELQIETLRIRTLLLASFGENLNDSLLSIFFKDKQYSTDEYMAQRNLCDDFLKKMQLSDIYTIDDISEGIYKDGLLTDIANTIEEDATYNNDEIKEAELMHKVLYAFIKAGYKKHQ